MERRHFPTYVLYTNKVWMIADLFEWEMERLSLYLKKNYPEKRFCILMDKCSSHKRSSNCPHVLSNCPSNYMYPLLDRNLATKSRTTDWNKLDQNLGPSNQFRPILLIGPFIHVLVSFSNLSSLKLGTFGSTYKT